MTAWTLENVGDQRGRVAVVTGANTGIGLETARVLVARGATVVLACRDTDKARDAAARIGGQAAQTESGSTVVCPLDLTSLASVRRAAERIRGEHSRLDLLINNAGVMMVPRGTTEDGFETHVGINHLGHFALTGLLLDLLADTPDSRVVTVSSSANRSRASVDLGDLNFQRRTYSRAGAYSQSKLANLMFSQQLQLHLSAIGASTISVGVEPGLTPTDLSRYATFPMRLAVKAVNRAIGQPDVAAGARIVLRAVTDPDARGGDYYAPDSRMSLRPKGEPVRIEPPHTDPEIQRGLWPLSERLTGVTYATGARSGSGL
jgi:NAD(P)-dependent dehydrogenase (short-subunit alcohol dehydrogenase family)